MSLPLWCRSRSWFAVTLLGILVGCDGGAGGRPRGGAEPPPQPESVPEIVMVLPARDNMVYDYWTRMAQYEAGQAKLVFNVARPEVNDPPSRQAEMIRDLPDRGVAAMILVPEENSDLIASAVAEVQDRGVIVVALGEPIDVPGRTITLVTSTPLEEASEAIVAKLVEDARKAGLSASGPARIVINDTASRSMTLPRAQALRAALEAAGIDVRADLVVEKPEETANKVREMMDTEAPPVMVLATDDQSLLSLVQYRTDMDEAKQPSMLIGGFADYNSTLDAVDYGLINAGVGTNLRRPGFEAVRVILDRLGGKLTPERVLVPVTIRLAKGPIRANRFPSMRNMMGDGPRPSDEIPVVEQP